MSLGLFIVTRGAYWQKHGGWLVKYRCKLEQAHNEEPFNNAFDLNRNVMKIITSLARPGDAPINGRSTTIQPSLFTLCVPPSISRLDLPRSSSSLSLPLLVSYLPRYRPLSLTRSRSDDEFIGGSRAEWSCIWPTECFVRRANVENEAFIGGRRCDARHRTASSSTFPSLLSPSSSFHAFLFVSPFSHLFVANRQRWENYEPKFFFFFFLRDSITIATVSRAVARWRFPFFVCFSC